MASEARTAMRRRQLLGSLSALAGLGTLGGGAAGLLAPAAAQARRRPAGLPPPLALGERVDWPAELPLLDGGSLRPEDWQDRAAVLVFWASHCPFCRRHNPHVQALHRAAQGRRLRVLTASFDPADKARAYLAQGRYDFPVTLQAAALAPRFSARDVLPLTVVVGRDGRLAEVIPGEMFAEDVAGLIAYAERPGR